MKYLSVLTPPALVCGVFLIALVAFLRHEMGPGRKQPKDVQFDEFPDDGPIAPQDAETGAEAGRRAERQDDV